MFWDRIWPSISEGVVDLSQATLRIARASSLLHNQEDVWRIGLDSEFPTIGTRVVVGFGMFPFLG